MGRKKINGLCECGKPAITKGLCRKCYDNKRNITTFAVARRLQEQVEKIITDKGWGRSQTYNFLIEEGLRRQIDRAEIANKYNFDL